MHKFLDAPTKILNITKNGTFVFALKKMQVSCESAFAKDEAPKGLILRNMEAPERASLLGPYKYPYYNARSHISVVNHER